MWDLGADKALLMMDLRCSVEDNRFLDMMERYFERSDEFKLLQERAHLHYQKYRLSKNLQSHSNTGTPMTVVGCTLAAEMTPEVNGPITGNMNIGVQPNKTIHINEALQMQIEAQRQLHEQLEGQYEVSKLRNMMLILKRSNLLC